MLWAADTVKSTVMCELRTGKEAVNIDMIGLIMMVAGIVGLIISIIVDAATRRRRVIPVEERREIIEE